MLIASCFAHKLHGSLSFSQFRGWLCPLRRCVGKQTPAAPELQLRDVVWSEESFFRLRDEANHQNTRICWVTVDFSFPWLAWHIVLKVTALFIFHAVIFTALPSFESMSVCFSVFLVRSAVDPQNCQSEGFGCRAALQRSMRLTMTGHRCDSRRHRRRPREEWWSLASWPLLTPHRRCISWSLA